MPSAGHIVDQATLLLSLQREIAELRKRNEEVSTKNKQEIQALCRENEIHEEEVDRGKTVHRAD